MVSFSFEIDSGFACCFCIVEVTYVDLENSLRDYWCFCSKMELVRFYFYQKSFLPHYKSLRFLGDGANTSLISKTSVLQV